MSAYNSAAETDHRANTMRMKAHPDRGKSKENFACLEFVEDDWTEIFGDVEFSSDDDAQTERILTDNSAAETVPEAALWRSTDRLNQGENKENLPTINFVEDEWTDLFGNVDFSSDEDTSPQKTPVSAKPLTEARQAASNLEVNSAVPKQAGTSHGIHQNELSRNILAPPPNRSIAPESRVNDVCMWELDSVHLSSDCDLEELSNDSSSSKGGILTIASDGKRMTDVHSHIPGCETASRDPATSTTSRNPIDASYMVELCTVTDVSEAEDSITRPSTLLRTEQKSLQPRPRSQNVWTVNENEDYKGGLLSQKEKQILCERCDQSSNHSALR